MKTLKFVPELVERILKGKKSSTWRLFDEKNLHLGDDLLFINKESGEEFGTAKITNLKTKTLGSLEESDWEGHEKFESEEKMYDTYRYYYGDQVGPDTEVKIINSDFTPAQK